MNLFNKIYNKLFIVFILFNLSITNLFAGGNVISETLENPLGNTGTIYIFLQKVLKVVADIGFPIAVLAIIYSGFLYVKAQGNDTKLSEAKSALTWSIVGTAVILGAWVLAKAIEGTISVL